MRYLASLARKDYEVGTKRLMMVCQKLRRCQEPGWQPAKEIVYQAAIFKTCALLETYVQTVIVDWFDLAKRAGQTVGTMPEEMKWYLILSDHAPVYQNYAHHNCEWDAVQLLQSRRLNRLFDSATELSSVLRPELILKGRKYPSVENLDVLFKRLGIPNFIDRVDGKIRRNTKLLLTSFLSIRQDIAHQEAPDLQYITVREQVDNVTTVVRGMDRVLQAHVTGCHGTQCWKTELPPTLSGGDEMQGISPLPSA